MLSNTLKKILFKLNLTIHTLQLMELANMIHQRELVKLLDSKMLHQILLINLRQHSKKDQLQLLLKLINTASKVIPVELSLVDVVPTLTTEFSQLDTELKMELTIS